MMKLTVPVSPEGTEATDRSISLVVNEAVRLAMAEDAEGLKAFQSRAQEPNLDFDIVVRSLRRRGKL
jgi:hypothetical protein